MDFGKEELERGFESNARSKQTIKRAREQLATDRGTDQNYVSRLRKRMNEETNKSR